MYKTFKMSDLNLCRRRTGTQGYQPKYLTKDGQYFIKEQAVISGQLREDWIVELFACKVAKVLGIGDKLVQQLPCIIDYGDYKRYGVYSNNFEKDGYRFISLTSLLYIRRDTIEAYNFGYLSAPDKVKCLQTVLSNHSNIPLRDCREYIMNLAVLDILTGNSDRHMKNLGCFMTRAGFFIPALIFDNGLGLGEFVSDKRYCKALADFERESYVSPYGEDPIVLLQQLHQTFGVGNLLKKKLPELRKLQNAKMPNNIFARQYYKKVLDTIERL